MTKLTHSDVRFTLYVLGGKNKHQKPIVKKTMLGTFSDMCP